MNFDRIVAREGTGSLKWEKYRGKDVLPLWVADMDFASPEPVLAALRARVEHGIFGYTIPEPGVVNAVLDYLKRAHGIAAKPEWLAWVPGLVPALNVVCRAFGNEGDAVMTATPVYPPFLSAPANQNRKVIRVPMKLEGERWTLDFEAMEQAVTKETRVFLLCSPHNPVGRVFSRAELERLATFCERHDLVLCSDEIHCDLVIEPGVQHLTTSALGPAVADRTITLMAPSKTYNLPGLSCAFAIIPNPKLKVAFDRAARGFITEVNCFGYTGCRAAYEHGEPWRQALLAYLRENRDLVYAFAKENLPGVRLYPMEATYLAWLDVRALGLADPAAFFESAGVGLSDGRQFGQDGFVRLNFGCPRSVLQSGLERMAKALRER